MRNTNILPSVVAANAITKLSEMLSSIGLDDEKIKIAVAFCQRGAEVDRAFREANGGGRVMIGVTEYSREGKTHQEVRGVDFFAVIVRKVVWAAYSRNAEKYYVRFIIDDNGALYSVDDDDPNGSKVWKRSYNYTIKSSAAELPKKTDRSAILIFNKIKDLPAAGVCYNLDFTADDGGARAAGLIRRNENDETTGVEK